MNAEESVELEQLMFVEEPMDGDEPRVHPAWLPPEAFRSLGARRVLLHGEGLLVDTVLTRSRVPARVTAGGCGTPRPGTSTSTWCSPCATPVSCPTRRWRRRAPPARRRWSSWATAATLGDEGFVLARAGDVTAVLADAPAGLLYGLFHVVRLCAAAFDPARPPERHRPALRRRMLNHWDNVAVHPVMGQVERGYAGGSIFWQRRPSARRPGPGAGVRTAAGRLRASTRSR